MSFFLFLRYGIKAGLHAYGSSKLANVCMAKSIVSSYHTTHTTSWAHNSITAPAPKIFFFYSGMESRLVFTPTAHPNWQTCAWPNQSSQSTKRRASARRPSTQVCVVVGGVVLCRCVCVCVTCWSFYPGTAIATDIARNWSMGMWLQKKVLSWITKDVDQGSSTTLFCCLAPHGDLKVCWNNVLSSIRSSETTKL